MYNKKMYELGNKPSPIRELYEYGKKAKTILGDNHVYDFSIGNPSAPTPQIVGDTIIELLNDLDSKTLHGYTSAYGEFGVRQAISDYLNEKYHANTDPDFLYLTCGAAAALAITFNAILEKNDEVVIFAPYFPEYKVFIEKAQGKAKVLNLNKKNYQIDIEKLKKAINSNTKAVLINSPNNPTGTILSEDTIIDLTNMLRDKEKELGHPIYLISDEPYRELIYDGSEYPFVTNYYDDSIICYSFSKVLSIPGERIGYILISKTCDDVVSLYKAICGAGRSLGYVQAPTLFQYVVAKCLGYTSDLSVYSENNNLLVTSLRKIGYKIIEPQGAFYIFMKALEKNAKAFSDKAKEMGLLLVPSDLFGIKGYVRIAYCVKESTIKNSFDAFKKLYERYQK